MHKKIRLFLPFCLCFVFALAGCGKQQSNTASGPATFGNSSTVTDDASGKSEDTNIAVLSFDGSRSYLTGLPLDSQKVKSRPVAIMIENTEACLPHYNLDKAGIIYETPVETNMTRYLAIYDDWENLDRIGNTRSARTYHIWLAAQYEAVLFHYGQSPFALSYLEMDIVDNVNGVYAEGNVSYYRSVDKSAPHNAYTGANEIKSGFRYKNIDTDYSSDYKGTWKFAADNTQVTLEEGQDCVVVQPYYFYNTPYFIYNSEDLLYYRYEFNRPETDAVSQNQYAVRNIIFMDASNDMYVDGNGPTQYLNFYMTKTEGTGKYFTNGKMVDIKWTSGADDEIYKYYFEDGRELVLNQGTTWICLIQNSYKEENKYYSTLEEFEAVK